MQELIKCDKAYVARVHALQDAELRVQSAGLAALRSFKYKRVSEIGISQGELSDMTLSTANSQLLINVNLRDVTTHYQTDYYYY